MTKTVQRTRRTTRRGAVAFRSLANRTSGAPQSQSRPLDVAGPAVQEALDALRPRHRAFVLALAGPANWNASEAYRLIRRPGDGAEAHARIRAAEIRARPDVRAAGRALQAVILRDWEPGELLDRLARAARADVTDVLDENGRLELKAAMESRILRKLRIRQGGANGQKWTEFEAEIHDPIRALVQIARIKGLV